MSKKQFTLKELTQGLDVSIQGDSSTLLQGVATLHDAGPGFLTFLTNPLYKKFLPLTNAGAVVLSPEYAKDCPVPAVISKNPYYIYAKMAAYFQKRPIAPSGIASSAIIGEGCFIDPTVCIAANAVIGNGVTIGANVVIGPGCVIGDFCKIDSDTRLEANVTLYYGVSIGKRVVIASSTVIGSDGFGNAKHQGQWCAVPQLGSVIIEDDVEIGANCAIDRGAIEDTVIEKGVRLDNLIQVGHNVRIGANTAIAGCVAIAGSAVIGKNCLIAGCTGINGHITIADNVVITGMTAVSKSIREPGIYSSGVGGLVTNMEWRKNSARFHRLDQLHQRVKELEKILQELTIEAKSP